MIFSVLHGLGELDDLNGAWAWIWLAVFSAVLFLIYAKADPPALPGAAEAAPTASAAQAPTASGGDLAGLAHDIEAELETVQRELND